MAQNLMSWQIHSAIQSRLAAMSEFAAQLARIEAYEKTLGEQLMGAVPEHLRAFVRENMIIEHVFKFGNASVKASYGDYGIDSYEDAVEAGKTLRRVWANNVFVRLGMTKGASRVEMFFGPVPLAAAKT